jgi:hypothetical protein
LLAHWWSYRAHWERLERLALSSTNGDWSRILGSFFKYFELGENRAGLHILFSTIPTWQVRSDHSTYSQIQGQESISA